jgi:enoyl-CoA hydratase/carnithine racemase
MGGGAGLSIYSPFIIATENTVFSLPEGKIGTFVSSDCYHALSNSSTTSGTTSL